MLYQDSSQPIDERVADLLSRMTLAEKIGQLYQVPGWQGVSAHGGAVVAHRRMRQLVRQGLGSIYGLFRADPWTEVTLETGIHAREAAAVANAIQRCALDRRA